MKKAIPIILMMTILSGCASTQPIIQSSVQAPIEIMKDCEDFKIPDNGSFGAFVTATVENKKIYELCKSQNKAKKDFILNTTR